MPTTFLPAIGRPLSLGELQLQDLENVRLILQGRSVVDWHRLSFTGYADIDRFLRVNEYNPESREDLARLEELRTDAIDYLIRTFKFPIPIEIADSVSTRDLMLIASRSGKHQRWACVILKVIHVINHIAGRNLRIILPLPDDTVFRAVELKIAQVVEELRAVGHPIDAFAWSRKSRDSMITKLLAKRSNLAVQIYDKLRFRLIVPSYDDLVPTLATLSRHLVPCNYIVPETSVNNLVDTDQLQVGSDDIGRTLQTLTGDEVVSETVNEFSSQTYRVVNFVVDLPLRVSSLPDLPPLSSEYGHIVFVSTEFQLVDRKTARRNEQGDSNHDAYKNRQKQRVRTRLVRGRSSE